MLRIFQLFGQSAALNSLDDALRLAGVHPLLVPQAVKLTVIRLSRQTGASPASQAGMIAYCMLGHETFADCNGAQAAEEAAARLDAAIEAGESPDAKLVLLTLHAGLVAPEIAERLEVEEEED